MKKFTCINDRKAKIDGAIEGPKEQVLAWMKKAFPGICKRRESEMMSAFEFFYEGEITAYKTADGANVYLAEVVMKKFTCLRDGGEKVKGAIEGSKEQVLAWMKKKFPGIRKAADRDITDWQFFYKGETTTYETPDGTEFYLAEVLEGDGPVQEDKQDSKAEKRLEKALKDYKSKYAKKHPEWARKEAAGAKMMDEEVAAGAAKIIWETARLTPQEQTDEIHKAGYIFHWRMSSDSWFAADIANRIFHDEDALKHLLCRDLRSERDDQDILMTNIRKSKFIHFQMTKAFNGGFDAYIVFRIPKSARVIIVRLCK